MKPFIIAYDGLVPHNGGDFAKRCRFIVTQGNLRFSVNIGLTGSCNLTPNDTEGKGDFGTVFLKIGLQRLKEKLVSGNYPRQSTITCEEIIITSDNAPSDLSQFLTKKCKYQKKVITGPICVIGSNKQYPYNRTTPLFCDACLLPDTDLICSHLIHPISALEDIGSPSTHKRKIVQAYCNKGEELDKPTPMVSMCSSSKRPCWEQLYEIPQSAISIPSNLPDRVADEIDFLNLLFDKKYSCQFIDISQARSIRDIGNKCKAKDEFVHKVQVVGHLINDIKVKDVLPAKKKSDKEGRKLLSITALKVFLESNYHGAPAVIVTNFEHIRTIRGDYPTHAKTRKDVTVPLDALQINYPIQNWQDAWQKVLYAFWESLNKLRLLIQYN